MHLGLKCRGDFAINSFIRNSKFSLLFFPTQCKGPHTFLEKMPISETKILLNRLLDNVKILTPFSKPICTKIDSDQLELANSLVSIFTKRPFIPECKELEHLGSKLDTHIVERALTGFKNWRIANKLFRWASNQSGFRHNCYTYNAMACILSRARQNSALKRLAEDMINLRCRMTPGSLGYFLRCLGSQGLVKEANFFFDEVKRLNLCEPNCYSYTCLLEVISKSNDIGLLESRLNEMCDVGYPLDKYALTPVLQCYCNAGKSQKALHVFNEMKEMGWLDAHVLSILVVYFSKLGQVDEAFKLIETMENLKYSLNGKTFFVLIHGFVKEGSLEKALQLLDKMQKLGIYPDISVFDVLIGGLCKKKEFGKALQLYSQMNLVGIQPDVKILCELISCVPSEKDMIQLLQARPRDLGLKSILLLYNSVLKGLINIGSVDRAYGLLRSKMGDGSSFNHEGDELFAVEELVSPNTMSFEIVIDALCSINKVDEALGLFHDIDCIKCQRSLLLYNNMINCLSNVDRLNECYELLIEMKKSGFQPSEFIYNSLFRCLCRRLDVIGARNVVKEMRTNGYEPWIKNYTLLICKLCEHGRAVEARNFLGEMVQDGFLPSMVAYSAVIKGFWNIKEGNQALQLFNDICARGYCPDVIAYNIMIDGLCAAKRMPEAQEFLNKMLEKGLIPSVVTYNLLIDGWCKIGDIDRATLCLSQMVEKEQEPNVITYTTLIDGLCNLNKSDAAMKLLNKMEGNGCPPNRVTFMALINGLCKCNKAPAALTYLQIMEERKMIPDAFIYVALIGAFLSISNHTKAFFLLEKMVHNNTLPDSADKNSAILKQAIAVMFEDPRTSSSVKNLMEVQGFRTYMSSLEV